MMTPISIIVPYITTKKTMLPSIIDVRIKPTHFTNISHQLNTWLLSKWNTLWKFANLMFSPSSFSLSFKKGTMRVHTWSPLLVVEYVAPTQSVLLSQLIGHVSPFFWAALHRVVSTVPLNNMVLPPSNY